MCPACAVWYKMGILPGKYGYESGQSCVGDHFAWFMQHCCPAEVAQKASELGMDVFGYMEQCAAKLSPGQSGLVALDWWNGNRSILVDAGSERLDAGHDAFHAPGRNVPRID